MCALFGYLDYQGKLPLKVLQKLVQALANASEVRGDHASGIAYNKGHHLTIYKRPKPAHQMQFRIPKETSAVMGHTRLTTQGSEKQNYNNHPFQGNAGVKFALAHNGVLYNDTKLRREKNLPETPIKTDSYIAVQLIEAQHKLDFDSLRSMAEDVLGNFTFTLLDENNNLWFVKGSSPLVIIHFPELGLYVYSSTPDIMADALKRTPLRWMHSEIIDAEEGDLIRISPDGNIERSEFDVSRFYSSRLSWAYDCWSCSEKDDKETEIEENNLETLLEICGYFGVTEEEVMHLRELGYSYDELEEFLFNPSAFEDDLCLLCGEI